MPSPSTVETFMAQVERGDFVGAIEQFYAPDATMQENTAPPRVGRDALVAHERRMLAGATITARRLAPPLFAGDLVSIRWRFEIQPAGRPPVVLDEIAFQTWRGDQIASETFFYDPSQVGR